MLWNAITFLLVVLPIYLVSEVLSPGAVRSIWFLGNLSGKTLLGIPLEDLIWYGLLGFFLGGAYPYLTKSKYIDDERFLVNKLQDSL
jgi:hypothetical protein